MAAANTKTRQETSVGESEVPFILGFAEDAIGATSGTTSGSHNDIDGSDSN